MRTRLLKISSVLLALFLVALCARQVDLKGLRDLAGETNLPHLFLASAAIALIPLLKTVQWQVLTRSVKNIAFARLFQVMAIRLMSVNLLPSWFGEALSLTWFGRREEIGPKGVLSILALDHLAEGFSVLVLFAVVALMSDGPPWMRGGMTGVVVVTLLFYVFCLFLARNHRDEEGPNSGGFREKVMGCLRGWGRHLQLLRNVRMSLLAIFLSLSVKGAALVALFLIQQAWGLKLPFETPFLVLAALHLATFFPVTPANLGLFESALLLVYRYLGLDTTEAFGLGIMTHLVFIMPYLLIGSATLLVGTFRWEKSPLDPEKRPVLAEDNG